MKKSNRFISKPISVKFGQKNDRKKNSFKDSFFQLCDRNCNTKREYGYIRLALDIVNEN